MVMHTPAKRELAGCFDSIADHLLFLAHVCAMVQVARYSEAERKRSPSPSPGPWSDAGLGCRMNS